MRTISTAACTLVTQRSLDQGPKAPPDRSNPCRIDLVHSAIHLSYAIDYGQPSLLTEALAVVCLHDPWPMNILLPSGTLARSQPDEVLLSALDLLTAMREDTTILSAV